MKKQELEQKHALYTSNITEWNFYSLAYDGGLPFITEALYRYGTRESPANWADRIRNGYVFNYAQSIVDLFNFYLTEAPAVRDVGELSKDQQWLMFLEDADLKNTNFDTFIHEIQKLSSVSGSIGILVNKPSFVGQTMKDEIESGVYPYVSPYSLSNIHDWKFTRNKLTHRMELFYLKLHEEDGSYLLWWQNKWERWELVKNTPTKTGTGINPLGEIPFVWMPNIKRMLHSYLGVSDIVDISRIVASIVRNLSCGEEILKLAGFPMMRIPMERDVGIDSKDDEPVHPTGPKVVHEFDASLGESGKPDWMPTEIYEPIQAILEWIDKKSGECYRVSHLSGIHGQRTSNEAQSGLALRYCFQQLFSVLKKKSDNMTESELQIIRLWMKWEEKEFKDVTITRSKEFSIDDLAVELDNAFTAMGRMVSKTYRVEMQKKVQKHTLPDLNKETRTKIETETEENTPEELPLHQVQDQTGGGKTVRPADQA